MPEETKISDSLEGGIDSGIGAASAIAGAASAKAAASASGATGAGAAAGTAAGGPAGTVLGAAAVLAADFAVKPAIKGAIVLALFLVMVFSSVPSMLFEKPMDIADNTGPQAVYQKFKNYAMEAYKEEIKNRKKDIEKDFQQRVNRGEFSSYDCFLIRTL